MEYRLRYRHTKGEAEISLWEETVIAPLAAAEEEEEEEIEEAEEGEAASPPAAESVVEVVKEGSWRDISLIDVSIPLDEQTVTMWLPYSLLGQDLQTGADQFCWLAEAKNKTKGYSSNPPTDRLPSSEDPRLTHSEIVSAGASATQPRHDLRQASQAAPQLSYAPPSRGVSQAVDQRIGGLVY